MDDDESLGGMSDDAGDVDSTSTKDLAPGDTNGYFPSLGDGDLFDGDNDSGEETDGSDDDMMNDEMNFVDLISKMGMTSTTQPSAPSLSKWEEIGLFNKIHVTVAKAKRSMWVQAMAEIDLIKKNVSELRLPMDVAGITASPLHKLYHTLFGSSSVLSNIFCQQLQTTKKEYLHFIFTFLLSCKNQQSAMTMHQSMEINTNILMSLSEYSTLWSKIKDQQGNIRQLEFWKLLEGTVNQQLKILFLSSAAQFPYLLGYDDDKLHFEYSGRTMMGGLSQQHHVKDNRKGLTLHTCAFSATCVPVSVCFQRFGESVQDTYVRSMKELFGTGIGGLPMLDGVTLASDRGYWEKGILFNMIDAGANIVGTVKRVRFVVMLFLSLSSFVLFFVACVFCCVVVVAFNSPRFIVVSVRMVPSDVRACKL